MGMAHSSTMETLRFVQMWNVGALLFEYKKHLDIWGTFSMFGAAR